MLLGNGGTHRSWKDFKSPTLHSEIHRPDFENYYLKQFFRENFIHFGQMCNNQKGNFQLWMHFLTIAFITYVYFWWLIFPLQIATQIAVLIAKVARLDCPRQWPELIPILIESVKVQDDLRQHRALLTFYHVTKTLASKRLAADRKLFYDVSDLT